MNTDSPRLEGLPPILDARVNTLVLGSFPSPASLAGQHYYAHRQNQFWRLMGEILGEPLSSFDYAGKQSALLRHRVGVWDVYRYCRREGALDSAIDDAEANDFSVLKTMAPHLQRICFNGQTAGKFARLFQGLGYECHVLPSSSPAYTLAFEKKLGIWRRAWEGAAPPE